MHYCRYKCLIVYCVSGVYAGADGRLTVSKWGVHLAKASLGTCILRETRQAGNLLPSKYDLVLLHKGMESM